MRNSSQKYQINIVIVLGVLLGMLMIALIAYAQPENDDIANAIVISAPDFTDTRDTTEATEAPNDPGSCFGGPSVWYVFTPTETRFIQANTNDSDYFAGIDVYTGTPDSLSHFACEQSVGFAASVGTTYFFRVLGGGNLVFSVLDLGDPLSLNLSINPDGSANPRTGAAIVQGTVTCNQPAGVDLCVQLRQTVGRKTLIQGSSCFSIGECNGETPWSVTVRSDQGAFGGGTTEVIADAGSGAFGGDNAHIESFLKLRGKKR